MQRRRFLAASLAASALMLKGNAEAATLASASAEFYQVRRYRLQNGPQTRLAESYFSDALIPALTRMHLGPVGAFRLEIGPDTPTFYLVIPGASVQALAAIDQHLAEDELFLKAADSFWNAPSTAPAFVEMESSLLSAFPGWPHLTPPGASATKKDRIFQLRTYESATNQNHVRKLEMFHHGEFEIFHNAGFQPVFFGDTLIGSRMPSLTYMLGFASIEELNARWAAFSNDPAWKALSSSPRYSSQELVSRISNLILKPLAASQI